MHLAMLILFVDGSDVGESLAGGLLCELPLNLRDLQSRRNDVRTRAS